MRKSILEPINTRSVHHLAGHGFKRSTGPSEFSIWIKTMHWNSNAPCLFIQIISAMGIFISKSSCCLLLPNNSLIDTFYWRDFLCICLINAHIIQIMRSKTAYTHRRDGRIDTVMLVNNIMYVCIEYFYRMHVKRGY